MAEKYCCQINFVINVETEDADEAAKLILDEAKKMVSDPDRGFSFKRESDGQVFLAADGKTVRVPKTIGSPPRL